jgi:hypothetical protein
MKGPDMVLVADQASVQNVLVHEDLVKAPPIAEMRLHRKIPSLISDVDKASHKYTVIQHKV